MTAMQTRCDFNSAIPPFGESNESNRRMRNRRIPSCRLVRRAAGAAAVKATKLLVARSGAPAARTRGEEPPLPCFRRRIVDRAKGIDGSTVPLTRGQSTIDDGSEEEPLARWRCAASRLASRCCCCFRKESCDFAFCDLTRSTHRMVESQS